MMDLMSRIEQALKEAVRKKNEDQKNALRLLLTAVKLKEKELKRLPNDAEVQQIISTLIKQRREAAEQYLKGNRQDLARHEEEEILLLRGFLPEALSPGELEKMVLEAVAETGAQSLKDMGKVMKVLMSRVAGRADGKEVNELARKKLGG
ncbi:MAG TPA: GatB/YqeY domain-containing protein [Syntrophobacteraceae bacterium]|nr:GatB/YqeY domain-containing protein [Syntrophobacteraceae bacterium]